MSGVRTTDSVVPEAAFPGNTALLHNREPRHEEVREQLDRILLSPAFRNSKRYSSLLKHVVERTLEGRCDPLKERTIGVEVFGRAPDYDTNVDHVVRSAAGEVRKRLAQYYQEPACADELRIDVHAGSYVPHFRFPATKPAREALTELQIVEKFGTGRAARPRWMFIATISIVGIAGVLVAAVLATRSLPSQTVLDRFWSPVIDVRRPILICIGNQSPPEEAPAARPLSVHDFQASPGQSVALSDAVTLARLTGLLQEKGKDYRVLTHWETTFTDLQGGPAILIGAWNNEWTRRMTDRLRFSMEHGSAPSKDLIRDKQNPSRIEWMVDLSVPYVEFTRDYAIVLRGIDPKTEQMVVTAAGISRFGTLAAGEFLTNPEHLKKLEAYVPKGWERRNLEIVLATDVVKGNSGPPTVIAVSFW